MVAFGLDADEFDPEARDPVEKSVELGLIFDRPDDYRHPAARLHAHALEHRGVARTELAVQSQPVACRGHASHLDSGMAAAGCRWPRSPG
jgi:hypothetical protein